MTIGSILLGLALLIVVGLILSKPLLTAGPQSTQSLDKRRQLELGRKRFLLRSMRWTSIMKRAIFLLMFMNCNERS